MKLSEALQNIHCIDDLNSLLQEAHADISWWGDRVISCEEYEGSVPLREVWKKYYRGENFFTRLKNGNPSQEERQKYHTGWRGIAGLYFESEETLKKTCLYRHIVHDLDYFRKFGILSGSVILSTANPLSGDDILNLPEASGQHREDQAGQDKLSQLHLKEIFEGGY